MNFDYCGKSICFREFNQDSYATGKGLWNNDSGYLFVVCDGMGPRRQAHSASFRATESIISKFYSLENVQRTELLGKILEEVNVELHREFRDIPEISTVVAALIYQERLHIFHVGDSRAYLVKEDKILQLTTDHTLEEELIRRGVVTREELHNRPPDLRKLYRALGVEDSLKIDISIHELQGDETIILCTDGMWGSVEERVVKQIVQENSCDVSVEKLLEAVKENEGFVDATVLVIHYK